MRQRHMNLAILTVVFAVVVAACGGTTGDQTTTSATDGPTDTPTTTTTEPSDTTEVADEPTEIVVSRWAGDPWESLNREAADAWAADTGNAVVVDALPYENLREAQLLELAGGGGYDILYVHPSWFGEYASSGYLLSIDELGAADPSGTPSERFIGSILEQGMYEGSQYCLQDFISTVILAYRTDLFDEAGLEPPTTWDEVIAAAEALNNPGTIAGIALPGRRAGAMADVYSTFLTNLDAWYFDDELSPTLDTDTAQQAVDAYVALAEFAPSGVENFHLDEAATAAAQGQAAMLISTTPTMAWLNDPERSSTVGNWGFVPLAGPSGTPSGELIYWHWCIAADTADPQAAYDYLSHFTEVGVQSTFAGAATAGATNSFYEDEAIAEQLPFLTAMSAALENSQPQPSIDNWGTISEALELALQEAILGQRSSEDAAQAIVDVLQQELG